MSGDKEEEAAWRQCPYLPMSYCAQSLRLTLTERGQETVHLLIGWPSDEPKGSETKKKDNFDAGGNQTKATMRLELSKSLHCQMNANVAIR